MAEVICNLKAHRAWSGGGYPHEQTPECIRPRSVPGDVADEDEERVETLTFTGHCPRCGGEEIEIEVGKPYPAHCLDPGCGWVGSATKHGDL